MKRKIITIFGYVVILALCFSLSFITVEIPVHDEDKAIEQSVLGEITDGTVISQKFFVEQKKIKGIKLRFATYEKDLTGNMSYTLSYAEGNTVLVDAMIDLSNLKDNQMYTIDFEKTINISQSQLNLVLKGVGTQTGNSATVYAYNKATENTDLIVNDQIVEDQTLNLSVLCTDFSIKRMLYLSLSMMILYSYLLFVLKTVVSKK